MARNLGIPCTDREPYYFISYNSEDEERVSAYAKLLSEKNVPMWYDNGIKVGVEFEIEIAEKIEHCKALIMFLSKNIFLKEKSYVHTEFDLATKYSKKTVYVVMLDKIEEPEVPIRFRPWWTKVTCLQCIHAYEHPTMEACMQSLMERACLVTVAASISPAQAKNSTAQSIERVVYDNGVYEGSLVDGEKHGKGKYTWKSGDVYEGDWVDDRRTGKGKYTWKSGTVYIGDWVDGKRTGKGKQTWGKDSKWAGDTYEGDWVNEKRTGKGKYIWANKNIYEGDFIEGSRTGKGKYIWVGGDVYEGDFIDGVRTGRGKLTKITGEVYEGKFLDDEFIG